jgi:hypothetical protein
MNVNELVVDARGGHGHGVKTKLDGVQLGGLHRMQLNFDVEEANHGTIDFYAKGLITFKGTVELGYDAIVVVSGPMDGLKAEYRGHGNNARDALADVLSMMPENP